MTWRMSVVPRAAVFVMLSACSREAPATLPEPPDVAAPMPAPAAVSRFSVPLEYDFSAVLKLVEQIVPRTFGSMDSARVIGDDQRKHYAFEAVRGPFSAFADENHLHLRATISYKARGYYKPPLAPTISAGCGFGSEQPRLVVELATPITLTPNWHLASKAHVVRLEPASSEQRDHCDVSFLRKDVTAQVVEAARAGLTSQLPGIDRKIAGVDLTERVTEWWGLLSRPIRLADAVWLILGPERLRVGRVGGRSKILVVPVSLDARPRIVTGTSEPEVVAAKLPPLGRDTTSNGFRVVMDGLIDYGTASRELTSALSAKSISASGHSITLKSVSVIPQAKGRLALSVSFTGDANGTVQFLGTPRIDHVRYIITVPDLDFDVRTDSKLVQTYSWLKSSGLRDELRNRARISTAGALSKGRALLLEGLNRKIGDAVTLSGTVDSVAVRSVFVTRDGMVVRAEAAGRAGMTVKQPAR
ncbi:MAG: DUF4403 family protein [Gemmatimonadota bacterium]